MTLIMTDIKTAVKTARVAFPPRVETTGLPSSRLFSCPECSFTADRDANGARNTMIRALQATAFTIAGDDVPILSLLSYEEI